MFVFNVPPSAKTVSKLYIRVSSDRLEVAGDENSDPCAHFERFIHYTTLAHLTLRNLK